MTGPSLGVLLFLPYRHLEQQVLTAVNDAGFPITLAQARLFQRIDDRGSRLTALAESAQLAKQSAAYLVAELVAAGYLTRSPDPSDGRAQLITITVRGRQVIDLARRVEQQVQAQWRTHLGAETYDQLHTALLQLREITDPFR